MALKPKNLDFPEAASVPLVGITVWETFFEIFKLRKEEQSLNNEKFILITCDNLGLSNIAI